MSRLHKLLKQGLERTAEMWPSIRQAYEWVHQAAHLLTNEAGYDVLVLRSKYRGLLAEMQRRSAELGQLAGVVQQFRKVTSSYWPGLFYCYEQPQLPRTNNDLEHCFGSVRYHERRASGRKVAAPALVVRGKVRLVASVVTRTQCVSAEDLRPPDLGAWRTLRRELDYRQEARRRQLRFRRDPQTYLSQLEELLLMDSLPT